MKRKIIIFLLNLIGGKKNQENEEEKGAKVRIDERKDGTNRYREALLENTNNVPISYIFVV